MGLADIKKELNRFDKDKLIQLITELYKKNKSVKEYFDFFVNPDENALFEKYKAKVSDAFYPKRGYELKLRDGKQAIAEFKKIEPATILLADLMLFYVECGVKFTNEFGDIDEAFYSSIEKVYLKALALMHKEEILDQFKSRAFKIVEDTSDIGWGFHDYLGEVYYNHYE
jgi:Family of unknown function (DUF6155)